MFMKLTSSQALSCSSTRWPELTQAEAHFLCTDLCTSLYVAWKLLDIWVVPWKTSTPVPWSKRTRKGMSRFLPLRFSYFYMRTFCHHSFFYILNLKSLVVRIQITFFMRFKDWLWWPYLHSCDCQLVFESQN